MLNIPCSNQAQDNQFNHIIISFLSVLFFTGALAGCATVYNPATERNEYIFISDAQEVQIGRGMAENVVKTEYPPLQDPQKQLRVNTIGNRIAAVSDRREIVYRFSILDSKDFNAFALPGGYVYIFSGLYDRLSEDEVAAVLAHEVGHIAAKHSVKRLQSALGYEALMGAVLLGLGNKDPALINNLSAVSGIIFDLLSKGYGREDEFLADKLSVKYLHKAGYDPEAMARSLQILQKEYGPGGRVFEVLSTHPRMEERIKRAKEEVATIKAAAASS